MIYRKKEISSNYSHIVLLTKFTCKKNLALWDVSMCSWCLCEYVNLYIHDHVTVNIASIFHLPFGDQISH